MRENGNAGMVPVQFLALSQAQLKAPGFMAQAGLESSVPQGLGRFRLLPNHQIRGKMGSGVQMREFNLMSRGIFLRDKAISSNMELWVSFNSL